MTNDLKIFTNNKYGEFRTTLINGEPYCMLIDVCKALEIANPRNTIQRLNPKGVHSIDTLTKCERKAPKFIYGDISSLKNNDSISLFFIVLYI